MGVFCPYLVPVAQIDLPSPLAPVVVRGRAMGVFAYVEYRPPSPLTYSELIWMPAMTEARLDGKRARGYYVARMYVDSEASLAGGRELWALPKTLARFARSGSTVRVDADDGTELELELGSVGPRLPFKGRISTLQPDRGSIVRFRGDVRAKVRLARVRIRHFESTHPAWSSFEHARSLARAAALMEPFQSTMQPPERIGQTRPDAGPNQPARP